MITQKALAIFAGAFFVCAHFAAHAQTITNVNGVRTVAYAANAKPKGNWSINPKPLQRITSDNGVDLLDIDGVVRFADGSLVALSRKSTTLHLFSANGTHVRNVGRKGKGPGEFAEYGLTLFRIRDTVVVNDGNNLAQVFAPDGRYLRTEARLKGGPHGEQVWRLGYFEDGRAILHTYPGRDTLPPARKMLYSLVFAERNEVRTEIGRFPYNQRLALPRGPGSSLTFGASGTAVVLRNGFCSGFSETVSLKCYAANGKQLSHVERRGVVGLPVSAADKEYYFKEIARVNPGPRQAAVVAEVRAVTKFAERMPVFGRLIASSSDEIWMEPSLPANADRSIDVPDNATVWSVFTPNGDWLSDITLPKRFRLMEVGANYVAGVLRDSDDVEEIVVYSLLKH